MTPPCRLVSPTRPSWARSTSIGVSAGSNCGAGRTSGVRLAVVFFSWLLLHHVGAGDSADASHVVGTSGVSRSGRLTGWTRPHGGERAPDAPVMQSGQKAKSYQTLAMGVGAACLLLKSSSSATVGECMRCTCMVRVVGVCRRMYTVVLSVLPRAPRVTKLVSEDVQGTVGKQKSNTFTLHQLKNLTLYL